MQLSAALQADRLDTYVADQCDPGKNTPGRNTAAMPGNLATALGAFLFAADDVYMDLAEALVVMSMLLTTTGGLISAADQQAASRIFNSVTFGSTGRGYVDPLNTTGETPDQQQEEVTFINNVARLANGG